MGKTTIALNRDYFTIEVSKEFSSDFQEACKTMELSDFTNLFVKYDLSFIEDYKEVFDLIAHVMTAWKNPGEETKLIEVSEHESKCLFCNIGKAVKAFEWTYKHTNAIEPMNRVIYKSKVGFYFGFDEEQLIEFGVCNAYV